MTLFHGDLLLWLGNIESDLVFSSSNITFSDNSWRVIHLQLSDSGYALYVNDSLLFEDIFDFVASPLILRQPFYMGGIPLNESSQVPYALCFTGGMKDLIIDSNSVSFFSGHSVGVSNAGVIPARVPPPTPPSCRAPLPPPTASNNDGTVHFNLQGSKGKGLIGFKLSDDQSNIFEESFVVGLTFRALSDDGLLLYATDNDTHPTQFFSVELVEGRILFQFNSGRGLVSISTKQRYSGNGHWYTVFVLRMLHFGAILMSTNEYANGRHTPPGDTMNLRRLYIGGLPSHVIAPTVTNRFLGFVGCIKDFDVANARDSLFDLSKPNMTGSNDTRGSCYDAAQPGLGFNGSAWVRFDNFSLNAEFNVQLTLRTSSRDGVLFLITGNSTSSPGNRMHVRLELSSGQIVLTYNTTMDESQVIWREPGLGNDTQSSYLICQMNWHSVRVTKKGPNVTISLDELHSVSRLMGHGTNMTAGELFLGGYPAQQLGGGHEVATGFKGCLKKFTLDGNSLHFAHAADLSQVSPACPLTSSENQSAIENEP